MIGGKWSEGERLGRGDGVTFFLLGVFFAPFCFGMNEVLRFGLIAIFFFSLVVRFRLAMSVSLLFFLPMEKLRGGACLVGLLGTYVRMLAELVLRVLLFRCE